MAGDAIEWRPISCTMAKVAKNLGMFSFQRPGVPGFLAGGQGGPERKERSTLRDGVTDRARIRERFTSLIHMLLIMASKTAGPIAVADIIGIGHPVHLHRRKDISLINVNNGFNSLANLSFLIF